MNRRSILGWFGVAALAPVLPKFAVAAPVESPERKALDVIAEQFRDPIVADFFTRGPAGERYRHSMVAHSWRAAGGRLVIDCLADFTGTVVTVEIRRGSVELCTLQAAAMDNPNVVRNQLIRVTLNVESGPTDAA